MTPEQRKQRSDLFRAAAVCALGALGTVATFGAAGVAGIVAGVLAFASVITGMAGLSVGNPTIVRARRVDHHVKIPTGPVLGASHTVTHRPAVVNTTRHTNTGGVHKSTVRVQDPHHDRREAAKPAPKTVHVGKVAVEKRPPSHVARNDEEHGPAVKKSVVTNFERTAHQQPAQQVREASASTSAAHAVKTTHRRDPRHHH